MGSSSLLGSVFNSQAKSHFNCVTHSNKLNKKYDINKNLTKLNAINKIIKEHKPQIIINFTALTDVNYCEINKELAYEVNFKIVENIIDTIKNTNIKFYHISTDAIYDKDSGFSKEFEINPKNYYAKSKLLADDYIIKNKYNALRVNFIDFSFYKTNFFTNAICEIFKGKDYHAFTDVFFNPLTLNQLSKIILEILLRNLDVGILNIGSTTETSKYHLLEKIVSNINPYYLKYLYKSKLSSFDKDPLFAKRSKNMTMNLDKMNSFDLKPYDLFDDFKNLEVKIQNYLGEI